MTEKEKQEIINIVHRTVLGFFDTSLDEERYLTETEKTLLEVNKAICNSIKKMPTVELPHGEWISKPKRIQVDETDEERIFETRQEWFCSSCGKSFGFRKPEDAFCKFCGSDNRPKGKKNCDNCFLSTGEQCDILVPSENCKYWKPKLKEGE